MELNAITRWNSVGNELHKLGKLEAALRKLQEEHKKHVVASKFAHPAAISTVREEGDLEDEDQCATTPILLAPVPKDDQALPVRPEPVEQRESVQPGKTLFVPLTTQQLLSCALRRFGKGFLLGWSGKMLFGLLPALVKLKWMVILRTLKSGALGTPFRYGAFIGGFLAVFETLMRIFRQERTHVRFSHQARPIVAGSLAGLCLLLLPRDSRVGIMLFFLVRAMEIAARRLAAAGKIPTFEHADTLVMALASAQVIWNWVFVPERLDPSYKRFLDHHGGRPRACVSSWQYLTTEREIPEKILAGVNASRAKLGIGPADLSMHANPLMCDIIHPHTQFCLWDQVTFFIAGLKRALPVYLPVYLLPLVLFRWRKLLRHPSILLNTGTNVIRSSVFLSAYCTICWAAPCFVRNLYGTSRVAGNWMGVLAGLCGGSMVILEQKSRRVELALYVLSHAILTAFNNMRTYSWFPYWRHFDVVLFSASLAVIMNAYITDPLSLRRSYLGLFSFLFGSGGKSAGFTKVADAVKEEQKTTADH